MLSKSAARKFFLSGTVLCAGAFILLTLDSLKQIPQQTHQENLSASAIRGKHLWENNNCMGCHTILGEGAYYAPELTKVYLRRGPQFIKGMLRDPEALFPGERRMKKYDFTETDIDDLVAFLKWIGEIDLNGYPATPSLGPAATPHSAILASGGSSRPPVFNQICVACHTLQGQGGNVGPVLDGVGSRRTKEYIVTWLKNPAAVKPGTKMPKLPLSDGDIDALATYLSALKGEQK